MCNSLCHVIPGNYHTGVRYNAEKTQVGKYYSTPIFQFRMKCHLCDNHFEIRNDPKVCIPACVHLCMRAYTYSYLYACLCIYVFFSVCVC